MTTTACPHCGGMTTKKRNVYGWVRECPDCGWFRELMDGRISGKNANLTDNDALLESEDIATYIATHGIALGLDLELLCQKKEDRLLSLQ